MKIKELYQQVVAQLKNAGITEPELEARWYLSHLLRIPEIKLWTEGETEVAGDQVAAAENFCARRARGEPFAHLVGFREFYGRSFLVNEHVLIPRPETEILVEEALAFLKGAGSPRLADFGAGSGCIGISLLCELPSAKLTAVDISAKALAVARKNAETHGVGARVEWIEGDVAGTAFSGEYDVVVANPPYIDVNDPEIAADVKKYEPHSALFSPEAGYAHIEAWQLKAAEILRPGGLYLCEIGAKQADKTIKIIENSNQYASVAVIKDIANKPRVIRALKKQV